MRNLNPKLKIHRPKQHPVNANSVESGLLAKTYQQSSLRKIRKEESEKNVILPCDEKNVNYLNPDDIDTDGSTLK